MLHFNFLGDKTIHKKFMYPTVVDKITTSADWPKRLDTNLNEPTKQISIKVLKDLRQLIRKLLGTAPWSFYTSMNI